jgi:hypothetical protein
VTDLASAVPAYLPLAALALIVEPLTVVAVAVAVRAVVATAGPRTYRTCSQARVRSWRR